MTDTPRVDAICPDPGCISQFCALARVLERELAEKVSALSDGAKRDEAGQAQIEHLRGALGAAHAARKEARADRANAMELLQRASMYAHGTYWPQDLFDAVHAALSKYENGLPLIEESK